MGYNIISYEQLMFTKGSWNFPETVAMPYWYAAKLQYTDSNGDGTAFDEEVQPINDDADDYLIIDIIDSDKYSNVVKSHKHPEDIIHFTLEPHLMDSVRDEVAPQNKGFIYYREDTKKLIKANFDWRNRLYRRWKDDNNQYTIVRKIDANDLNDFQDFPMFNLGHRISIGGRGTMYNNTGGDKYWSPNVVFDTPYTAVIDFGSGTDSTFTGYAYDLDIQICQGNTINNINFCQGQSLGGCKFTQFSRNNFLWIQHCNGTDFSRIDAPELTFVEFNGDVTNHKFNNNITGTQSEPILITPVGDMVTDKYTSSDVYGFEQRLNDVNIIDGNMVKIGNDIIG